MWVLSLINYVILDFSSKNLKLDRQVISFHVTFKWPGSIKEKENIEITDIVLLLYKSYTSANFCNQFSVLTSSQVDTFRSLIYSFIDELQKHISHKDGCIKSLEMYMMVKEGNCWLLILALCIYHYTCNYF